MKNHLSVLIYCVIISACAKKTYVAENSTLSHNLKKATDSSAHSATLIKDKTITIINRSIDTSIIVTGKALTGYLLPPTLKDKDTSAYFENEDLTLFLSVDKNGQARATAIPKLKTINAKVWEQTTVFNDIIKKEETDLHAKSDIEVKTSLTNKRTQKETTGNKPFIIILIALLTFIFIWIGRKILAWGKIFGDS